MQTGSGTGSDWIEMDTSFRTTRRYLTSNKSMSCEYHAAAASSPTGEETTTILTVKTSPSGFPVVSSGTVSCCSSIAGENISRGE